MTNPLTYLLIVCMLASIFTQTHFLAQVTANVHNLLAVLNTAVMAVTLLAN